MKRYVPLLLLMVLAAAALAACGPAATPLPPTATPVRSTATPLPPAATSAAPGPFPLTITDDLGRQVTLSAPARRVISLAPSNTEIIFAVGAGGQVVGVTEYCNYPPQAQSLEKIGGFSANTISVEKIVSLEPDLVLSVGDIQRPVIDAL